MKVFLVTLFFHHKAVHITRMQGNSVPELRKKYLMKYKDRAAKLTKPQYWLGFKRIR